MDLIYGLGEKSFSKESQVFTSDVDLLKFDYLVFVDSRGYVNNENIFEYSYISLLKDLFETLNKSYIIISRPKNLTIFSTLINFLKLNSNLKFKYLITNLGFVDCTPKKQKNIDDILLQMGKFSSSVYNTIIEYENYKLGGGNIEMLKSIEYSKEYIDSLNRILSNNFEKCYYINTPIVSEKRKMERKRPKSFFKQLYKTNELINDIVSENDKYILVDISNLDYTYDGVHYVDDGHEKIFNKIQESIEL